MPLTEAPDVGAQRLVGAGLRDRIRVGASGKVASGVDIVSRVCQGADFTMSARAMMFAVGCIQALKCNTNHCPTGVATQDPARARALDVPDKTTRVFNFQRATVASAAQIVASMGLDGFDELIACDAEPAHRGPADADLRRDLRMADARRVARGPAPRIVAVRLDRGVRRRVPLTGFWPSGDILHTSARGKRDKVHTRRVGHPPSGAVTFLLTDLEGSTRLWEQDPDAMKAAMVRHDELLEKTIAGHQGFVFSRMGDGMAAAFGTARDAVNAATTIQSALTNESWITARPLRTRIGLHTDEGVVFDNGYASLPINRCSRLMSSAHGGQVVVSSTTEALVREQLPDGDVVDRPRRAPSSRSRSSDPGVPTEPGP